MAWAQWYEKTTDVDGFRFQEAEAIPAWFVKDFIEATSDVPVAAKKKGADEAPEYVHKDIFAVGDFWHWNTEYLNGYIKATDNEASMFDVPLHFNFHDASVADGEYNMADLLKGSLMMSNPEKAVTFVDNHESQVEITACNQKMIDQDIADRIHGQRDRTAGPVTENRFGYHTRKRAPIKPVDRTPQDQCKSHRFFV